MTTQETQRLVGLRIMARWYFLDNTGVMQTGVIKVNGKTYCLNKSGAMVTGKVIVNNKTYKVLQMDKL